MKKILARYSRRHIAKVKNIKAIFFDVDGVLTDGKIIFDNQGF